MDQSKKTKKLDISQIRLNPNNPRTIKDDKFRKLCKSLKDNPEFLDARPIVVKDNMIIGGNMRYKALLENKMEIKPEWVKDVTGWTDEAIRKFIVVDNIAYGDNDWDLLANQYEKEELEDWGMDVDKWAEDEVVEDEVPEVTDNPISVPGEIYQLGRHRVMCGSATKIEDITLLMGEQKADLLVTDPPYNVEYVGKTKDALTIQNDKMDNDSFRQFLVDSLVSATTFMKSGASFYVWHADSEGYNFRGACKDAGLLVKQCLIWNKNSMVMGRQDYQWKHEPCLYGWKDGGSHNWYADRTQTTIINFDRPTKSGEHPTMKPIGLMAYQIGNSSKSGDLVIDLFLGSGSTLMACEQTDRVCYGTEIDPKYVDVIRKRYAKFIGKEDNWEEITPCLK